MNFTEYVHTPDTEWSIGNQCNSSNKSSADIPWNLIWYCLFHATYYTILFKKPITGTDKACLHDVPS